MRAYLTTAVIALAVCCSVSAQDLNSTDPKARVKAARSLAKAGSESIGQLVPLLKDPVVDVRREAVKSIVAIGTQYSLDPLIAATKDNDAEVQLRATDGIVNFYLPGYVETGFQRIGSAVKSRFDRENTQVVDAYVTVRPDTVQAIGALVKGGASMDVRASAARAVGILRGQAALPELLDALRTKDDAVIYESLIAIQKIRDASAGPRVVFLIKDLQERVQVAAIEVTGILKTREAVPDLQKVFTDSRSDKVRKAALSSLAMIAEPSSAATFRTALNDKNDGVRAAAAEGLSRLKDDASRSAIEKAFNEEKKMNARLGAAFALVMLGNRETSELAPFTYLVNTLNSKSYRDVAQAYLIELAREQGPRELLYGFLRQGTREEKIGLARVLAVSGDRNSLAHIEALTKDPDSEVAQEAIRAIKNLQARLG